MKNFFSTYIPAMVAVVTLLAALGEYLVGNSNAMTAYVLAFSAWVLIASDRLSNR
jgi:hypothetical protein